MRGSYLSLIAIVLIIIILVLLRVFYLGIVYHIFEWDSLGYYIYLPSHFIYHDIGHLKWWGNVLAKYHFPGNFYQAMLQPNGQYVFYYQMGLSLLQMPFFFI